MLLTAKEYNMKVLNNFQIQFMKEIADIQKCCVINALYRKHNYTSKEEEIYSITSEVIYRIMELIDGYSNSDIGKLDIINEKTGERLKKNPIIELHDVIDDYIKE